MENPIESFYQAFQQLDAEKMISNYHPEMTFQDPAFGKLAAKQAANMWRMLCANQKGKDFRLHYYDINLQDNKGGAVWEAQYNFSRTGRRVHNVIRSSFVFKDGLIFEHIDEFNLHKWASQALGWQGKLIGWTPFFKRKLQQQTQHLLNRFENRNAPN